MHNLDFVKEIKFYIFNFLNNKLKIIKKNLRKIEKIVMILHLLPRLLYAGVHNSFGLRKRDSGNFFCFK